MDSAGVGALPDAATFGDAPKANTIGNVAERVGGLHMPNFERLGLGRTTTILGCRCDRPAGAVGRLREKSRGKDTITDIGRWLDCDGSAVPNLSRRLPADVIDAFTAITGKVPLGNVPASGTELSPKWARSISAPVARSSTPRPTRYFRLPATRTRFRWRPSMTGVRRRGRARAAARSEPGDCPSV